MTAARSCPCSFAPIHLQPYAPVLPLLCDECMIFVPHRPNAVVCTRVRESSLWAAVVTAIRFLDGHPSSPEPPAPIPPVTNLSTPAVRVGVGAVVRRAGDSSILVGVRCGSHGAGYSPFFCARGGCIASLSFTFFSASGRCQVDIWRCTRRLLLLWACCPFHLHDSRTGG